MIVWTHCFLLFFMQGWAREPRVLKCISGGKKKSFFWVNPEDYVLIL
jgi:hypothetical protein